MLNLEATTTKHDCVFLNQTSRGAQLSVRDSLECVFHVDASVLEDVALRTLLPAVVTRRLLKGWHQLIKAVVEKAVELQCGHCVVTYLLMHSVVSKRQQQNIRMWSSSALKRIDVVGMCSYFFVFDFLKAKNT